MRLTVKLAVVVVTLAVAASTAGASVNAPKERTANNLTVWLQVDARSGWPEAVAAANAAGLPSDHDHKTRTPQRLVRVRARALTAASLGT